MRRRTATRRIVAPVAALALTTVLAGCAGLTGGSDAGATADAGASAEESPGQSPGDDADAAESDDAGAPDAGAAAAASTARVPQFPVLVVPDLTAMNATAAKTGAQITAAATVPGAVQVTGARCDANGRVITRSGLTVGGADDGSVVNGSGVQQVGKGGAGQLVGKDVVYQVNKDGSGQITTGVGTVQVQSDGSGQYVSGEIVYQVNKDGSGQYTSDVETVQVDADGSGQWVGPLGTVQNAGDGSGRWIGPDGIVVNNGDGTGTVGGVPTSMEPLPPVAPLGRFPSLAKLKPVGRSCGTLIRISAEVLFDFDADTLRPEAGPVLEAVAKALGTTTSTISVNGHTDAKGSDSYNLDLSERRAGAVLKALVADGLAAPMTPHGFGETQPVAPNTLKGKDNPAGRQLNRRVELVVSG